MTELLLNLVQIGLTVSAAATVLFLLRKALKKRYPARAMCVVWALLAIRLLIPVQLTLPDAPVQVTPRTTYLSNVEFSADAIERAELPVYEHDGQTTTTRWVTNDEASALRQSLGGPGYFSTFDLGRVLFLLWIAGAALYAVWQGYQYHFYRYVLEHSSHPAARDTLRRVFEEQKQALGITRDIPLRVTPAADCPMLAGFVKPALYLPDEALTEQEAMFIFRHELTHCKRHDLWLKLLLTAAQAVHWFNPLVHLLARFAQEDIELACDDAVVRGMDGAFRRAYGETILKSAAAQAKRRALVSCFTGDKKTLLRRFEGIFDKRAKKRGVALVAAAAILVGTLGCAVSVGESKNELTEELRLQLAQEWLQRTEYEALNSAVKLDGDDTYILYDHYNTVVWEGEVYQSLPLRVGEKLSFEKDGDSWQVSGTELIAESGVTSLDEFRILYENDLGFPDFLGRMTQDDWAPSMMDVSTPDKAVVNLLNISKEDTPFTLSEPIDVTGDGEGDLLWCQVEFLNDNGNTIDILLIRQAEGIWLPQDFTYDGGKNDRTAADLAQQYARGVLHKSGQFIYPILSAEKQQDFITQQRMEDGGINWKYGGSSPSYRDFALVPTSGGDYIAVFQMYGGGADDYRAAYLVETGSADGRSVIQDVRQVGRTDEMTYHNLFDLYYNSGLDWPSLPDGAESFNGVPVEELAEPWNAAAAAFRHFAGSVDYTSGADARTTAFTAELSMQSGDEATVELIFTDGSPSTEVRMEKTGDYWLPVGLAEQFDDSFTATAGGMTLPVGATVAEAVAVANGDIPLLETGTEITIAPMGGGASNLYGVLNDSIINADGSKPLRETESEMYNIPFADERRSYSTYTVAQHPSEVLLSTAGGTVYRAVELTYHIGDDRTMYHAAFVYGIAGDATAQPDYTITSTTYRNGTYGYTLTLPDCFVGQGYAKEQNGEVAFGLKDAWPGEVSDPYDAGGVMTLMVMSAAEMHDIWGENWTAEYPVPAVELAERNGLLYYLAFASDVQYDPADEQIAAVYTEMYQAAQAMGPASISFDGQTDAQHGREYEQALYLLGRYYAARVDTDNPYVGSTSIQPNPADGSCTIVWEVWTDMRPSRRAEQAWFADMDNIAPARTEALGDSADGVTSLTQFRLFYDNGAALPTFDETSVRALLADTSITALRDPVQAAEWTLGLAGGTAGDRVVHPVWQGESFVYTWADGSQARIAMIAVQLENAAQPIYLPISWSADIEGRDMWALNPYRYMMLKERNDFSDCTAEELAYYLTLSDGAYTENLLHELDLRWQDDPAGTDAAVAAYAQAGNGLASLWANHKAAYPDIFS